MYPRFSVFFFDQTPSSAFAIPLFTVSIVPAQCHFTTPSPASSSRKTGAACLLRLYQTETTTQRRAKPAVRSLLVPTVCSRACNQGVLSFLLLVIPVHTLNAQASFPPMAGAQTLHQSLRGRIKPSDSDMEVANARRQSLLAEKTHGCSTDLLEEMMREGETSQGLLQGQSLIEGSSVRKIGRGLLPPAGRPMTVFGRLVGGGRMRLRGCRSRMRNAMSGLIEVGR